MVRILAALLCTACGLLPSYAQQTSKGFVRKPLAEIMQGTPAAREDLENYPVYFTIPNDFIMFYGGDRVGILLATQEDINAMTQSGSIQDTKSGFFRVASAPGNEYDSMAGKFTDESDPASREKLAAAGLKNCSFRRVDSNGVPMLASTCMKGGRHTFMLHIANARPDDPTLKVFYFHPPVYSQRDEAIWARFIEGLSGKK